MLFNFTKQLLKKNNLRPRKRLGQSFLINPRVLSRIIETVNPTPADLVLEIGTGLGVLTQALAQRAGKVVTLEIDKRLLEISQDTLKNYPNIEFRCEDILKVDLASIFKDYPGVKTFKIAANLPYYITTPIITSLLESKIKPELIILMLQKEVAKRLVASPGSKDYGAISVFVQYYTHPRIVLTVSKSSFYPRPEVDSAVIALTPHPAPPVQLKDKSLFFNIVRAAFGYRRKTLKNALIISPRLKLPAGCIEKALSDAKIDPERRGETLSLQEFAAIEMAINHGKKRD